MMVEYSDKAIIDLQSQREQFLAEIEKLQDKSQTSQQRRSELGDTIREKEEELDRAQQDRDRNQNELNLAIRDLNVKKAKLSQLDAEIQAQEKAKTVKELFDKQPSFYESLEKVYKSQTTDSLDGLQEFGSFIDSSDFMKIIRQNIDSLNFNRQAIEIRSIKGEYEETLRQLCQKKIEGRKVTANERMEGIHLLERFLYRQDIEPIWNKG